MSKEQASHEALEMALKSHKKFALSDSNWEKNRNQTVAQNIVETDRGKYSDILPIYILDQETRDRLIVHARQDAAEALLNTKSLMEHFYRQNKSRNEVIKIFIIALLIVILGWLWKH